MLGPHLPSITIGVWTLYIWPDRSRILEAQGRLTEISSIMAVLFLAVALSCLSLVYSATHVPLATKTVSILGTTTDPASNPNIFHDGNGGVTQNGYNMIIFADSLTNGDHASFVHNSLAYFGYVSWGTGSRSLFLTIYKREPGNPLDLYTFGVSGTPGQEAFVNQPFTAVQANETALGGDFAIWAGLSKDHFIPNATPH